MKRCPKKAWPLWGHKHRSRLQAQGTEHKNLSPCDQDVYANGTTIFVTDTIRSFRLEPWVRKIAAKSGQQVDWNWAGGRACVYALGDIQKAREALASLLGEHDKMYSLALSGSFRAEFIRERLSCMHQYAGFPPIPGTTAEQVEKLAVVGSDERTKYTVEV